MQITRSKTQYLPTIILIVAGVLVFAHGDVIAYYQATYAESAHGNNSYGVNRSDTDYPVGSCAHCHDTFDPTYCGDDPNGLMLFASNNNPTANPQEDNFCYKCHDSDSSVQAVTNYSYSRTFGGGSSTTPDDIKDAFNLTGDYASSHNLSDVLNHAVSRDNGFTSDTNPCFVCHDHHASQQNYPVTLSGLGGVKTAIRRPLDYANSPTNLWGDEDKATSGLSERMLDYTTKYQAPYYYNDPHDPNKYEPANDGTYDGSNLPNVVQFCRTGCHTRDDVYSTEHGRNLTKIDWGTGSLGNKHGKKEGRTVSYGGYGYTIAPYTDGRDHNEVLACTDCHEPHGSPNESLLRTSVNGKDNITMRWVGDWGEFCRACHMVTGQIPGFHSVREEAPCCSSDCKGCHRHDISIYF
jgi:hypothetical protein